MNSYEEWIENYTGDIHRKCKEVSEEMQQVFPELRIAKGLVQIEENRKWYQHQWCVDPDNYIIDPTAKQWMGIIEYKEIGNGDPYPRSKCINCGSWVFSDSASSSFCSEECVKEYNGE